MPRTSRSVVFVVALCLGSAVLAEAQGVTTDMGIGFGLGKELGVECEADGISLADCAPLSWGLDGEVAVHVHERVALFGDVGWTRYSLDTTATIFQPPATVPAANFPIGVDRNDLSVRGGARFYAQPVDAAVRAFAAISAGWLRYWGQAMALGFSDGGSASGFGLFPGGGVDFRLSDRVTYRLAGRFSFGFVDGERSTALGLATGVVFRLPR